MISSVQRLGLPLHFERHADRGSWPMNTLIKQEVLLRACVTHPSMDILWVDCDAEIHEDPTPWLEGIKGPRDPGIEGVAVRMHHFGAKWCTGTIWFGRRPLMSREIFLENWILQNVREPKQTDQETLMKCIERGGVFREIVELGPELCFIWDLSAEQWPDKRPVIEHYQASRKFYPERVASSRRYKWDPETSKSQNAKTPK